MLRFVVASLFIGLIACAGGEGVDFNSPFSDIYQRRVWNPVDGPLSGKGSNACHYMRYLVLLQHIIGFQDIKEIVEIGFGDFQMNQHMIFEGKSYRGYDVVKSIMRETEYNVEFNLLHNLKQINHGGDLLIVKDVMQHWPNSQIHYLIDTILPRFKYALMTNDMYDAPNRNDIQPGGHALIPRSWLPHSKEVINIFNPDDRTYKGTFFYQNPERI